MFLLLASSLALAGPRPAATDDWVLVDDSALLCAGPGGQGPCARFRAPGADVQDGDGPRVFRLVSRQGDQVQVQAQLSRDRRECGVLPTRITPLYLRLWVPASAVRDLAADDSCMDPSALEEPPAGRDWDLVDDRLAVVEAGTVVQWPDGRQAGQLRAELWLWEEHGPTLEGGRVCASFDLGPDDGGPAAGRAFDVCFDSAHVSWDR